MACRWATTLGAAACAVAASSCVSSPVPDDAPVRFAVATHRLVYPSTDAPFAPAVGLPSVPDPVPGASCVLWNDLGQWTVETPGTVEVPNSVAVLAVRCTAPGFRPSIGTIACVSKGARGWGYAYAGGIAAAYLLTLPAQYGGGSFTKEGALVIGLATAATLYGLSRAAAPDASRCRYAARHESRIDVLLEP